MLNLRSKKFLALILVAPLVLSLQACSSTEKKVAKACALADRASDMLRAKDMTYTSVYSEAADILQELAAEDQTYEDAYKAALLWASGNNFSYADFSVALKLQALCSPDEEE